MTNRAAAKMRPLEEEPDGDVQAPESPDDGDNPPAEEPPARLRDAA
ncbi:hypothetical protein ACFOVU_16420 [Nocardiopsis sediminis]|uniref:Uncharacterized protein n=1 Tax=Nocardiopsis sediminis TaxID=1778267 RepID=A0ABV8FQ49_9ACTN